MSANLVNVLIGLGLTYVAILQPRLLGGRPLLFAALGVLMFAAAWQARRSDHHPWQNNTNMLLALLLVVLALARVERFPLASFWSLFWIGLIVSVLALWAALYRPNAVASSGEQP
jgi:sulfite exporter TauE/SafE